MRQQADRKDAPCRGILLLHSAEVLRALFIFIICLVSPGWAQVGQQRIDRHRQRFLRTLGARCQSNGSTNATGLQRKAISSAEGAYYFPKLPVGTYTVTFDKTEFQSLRFDDVVQKLGATRT